MAGFAGGFGAEIWIPARLIGKIMSGKNTEICFEVCACSLFGEASGPSECFFGWDVVGFGGFGSVWSFYIYLQRHRLLFG